MSIPVVCPNGHSLRAQENLAGKSGLCPVCKAPVKVPQGTLGEVSEDSILNFLSSQTAGRDQASALGHQRAAVPAARPPGEGHSPQGHAPPKKSCGRCNREIPAQTHICPFCHAYVGGLSGV